VARIMKTGPGNTCLLIAFLLYGTAVSAQNFAANSLFADPKASRVGDIVTIHIQEQSQGSNAANSSTAKDNFAGASTEGNGAMKFFPLAGFNIKNNIKYSGRGDTKRTGKLQATMTARITAIDPNGNLVIEGTREVGVNGDKMQMTLTGVVRPLDVSNENIIMSYQIADAKISYHGTGITTKSQKPGWISRIFTWLF